MKEQVVISVKDVKKNFKVYYDRSKTIKDLLSRPGKGKQHTREVLKGISFEVKKGEAVALIGKNGCGKSTMLKLLTRIIYPDSGSIKVNGKVSSMLELGAGFHPDMSGRENIYLNASIFGLTRRQIEEKVDAIIAFSELENFIDNPVRTYSSGMYMRLAFSVAINVQAEILLIDEILGVGDVRFQKKCFNKLKEIKNEGVTIVIVSHSMSQIEQICDRSIWICDGVIKEEGEPKEIAQHYYQHMGVYNEEKAASRTKEKSQKAEAETKQKKKADVQEFDKTVNGQPENGKTASEQPESSMSQTDAAENSKSGNSTARTGKAESGKSGNDTSRTDKAESSKSGNDTARTGKAESDKSGNGASRTGKAESDKSGSGAARTNGQPSETQMNPQPADSNAWMEQVKASERSYAEKSEVEKLLDQIYNLKVWIQELENGKAWLEQHSVDMENHIRDLEEGKAWLEQHSANMEKHIHELEAGRQWQEQHSEDMENYISDLEEGKLWLEQHVEDLETYIRSLEEEE